MNLLDVKALTAGYGSRTIIDNLDFSLSDNEVVAIIGGNGSGKSTFLRHFLDMRIFKVSDILKSWKNSSLLRTGRPQ